MLSVGSDPLSMADRVSLAIMEKVYPKTRRGGVIWDAVKKSVRPTTSLVIIELSVKLHDGLVDLELIQFHCVPFKTSIIDGRIKISDESFRYTNQLNF